VDDLDDLRPVLKPAQEHVLATLAGDEDEYFGRADYEAIAHVSRSQAAYDLADLVKLGLVERVGSGRGTRYRIVPARGGRRRKWTPDRIRDELEAFCDEIGAWPRAAEFKETGRGDLYLAASRYGGIEHWAEELGFREPEPEPEPDASSAPSRLGRMARTTRALVLAALLAFGLGLLSGSLTPPDRSPTAAKAPMRTPADAVAGGLVAERQAPKPQGIALRLAAVASPSWVSVRRGSGDGRVVWQGTLAPGKTLRLHGRRLWLRLGAPENLDARLDGKRVGLPEGKSTLVATRKGLRVLSSPPSAPPTGILVDAPATTPVVTVAGVSSPAPTGGDSSPSPDPQPGSGGPAPAPQP
jgi:hypothetical protein